MDGAARRGRAAVLAACAVGLFSLWLRTGFPIHAIPDAGDDDALFVAAARHLLAGDWLGPYADVTLVKGVGYPLLIAAAFLAGIPLSIAEQLCLLAACALAAYAVARNDHAGGNRRMLGLVLFCLLCLNPAFWFPDLLRVIRETLYTGQTLAVLALAILVAFPSPGWSGRTRGLLGLVLGLVFGWFWLTREEGPWLLPPLLLIPAAGLLLRRPHFKRGFARGVVLPWCAAALGAALCVAAVAAVNARAYGVFTTNELKSAAFVKAYGALSRIRPAHWQRYIVFPPDTRARAYAVSPAARELAPLLDGAAGRIWAQFGCDAAGIQPCIGFHAGWFLWVLRDAMTAAGHGGSARDARRFELRLAGEINRACADGRLSCLPPRATLAPPFRWQYVGDTLRELPVLGRITFGMGGGVVGAQLSAPALGGTTGFRDLVGAVAPAESRRFVVSGSATAAGGAPVLSVTGDADAETRIRSATAADLAASRPGQAAIRFFLQTDCPPSRCTLVAEAPGGARLAVPLNRLAGGASLREGALELMVAQAGERQVQPATSARRALLERLARGVAWAYAAVVPIAGVFGLLGLCIAAARTWRDPAILPLVAFAWSSACAVACRIFLLSYLQVTSVPSEVLRYAAPATPLVLVYETLGIYLGLRAAGSAWRGWSGATRARRSRTGTSASPSA